MEENKTEKLKFWLAGEAAETASDLRGLFYLGRFSVIFLIDMRGILGPSPRHAFRGETFCPVCTEGQMAPSVFCLLLVCIHNESP